MDAGALRDVLTHQVHHHVERLHGIERGTAFLGGAGGMRRAAVEVELHLHVGEPGGGIHSVARVGVPVQHGVQAFENALTHHVRLAAAALLGRTAKELHGALMPLREPAGNRHCTGHRARSEQVMPASVPVRAGDQRLAVRHCVLGHPRERVVLGHHSDHRDAAAIGSNEGRWYAGHSPLHHKPLALKERGPLLSAAELGVAGLGIVPDALLQRVVEVETGVQVTQTGGLGLAGADFCVCGQQHKRRQHYGYKLFHIRRKNA